MSFSLAQRGYEDRIGSLEGTGSVDLSVVEQSKEEKHSTSFEENKVLDQKMGLQETQPEAADPLRAAVYQNWLKKKEEKLQVTMKAKKQEEKLKEEKKAEEEMSKKAEAKASYEAWKEKKRETIKEKIREKQEAERKQQKEKEEKEERKETQKE
ncbi:hypothetical protein SRHO_G00251690 [Serrasalmus rhombeus]